MESHLASKAQARIMRIQHSSMEWLDTVQTQLPQWKAHTLCRLNSLNERLMHWSDILLSLSFINSHTFSLIITYIKTSSANPMGLRSPGRKIEAPSIWYPTLPMLILGRVPMGMHTPIPTLMIKTSRKDMEGWDSQVLRQTYVHVLVCGTPPSWRS